MIPGDPNDPRLALLAMLRAQLAQGHQQLQPPADTSGELSRLFGASAPSPAHGLAVPDAGWSPQGMVSFPTPAAHAPVPVMPEDNGQAGMINAQPDGLAALLAKFSGARRQRAFGR